MNKLHELEKQYERLGVEIERLKREEWPQIGEEYWHITLDGQADSDLWTGGMIDHYRLASGNCHRTKEQAIAYDKWRTSPRTQSRRMVEMCEGFSSKGEWFVVIRNDCVAVLNFSRISDGGLQFAAKSKAISAIDKLGEPLIKVALGVITGEEAEQIVMEAMRK